MANVADYNVANASGASVRSDINNILQAVVTLNSGTSEPSTMYPFMIWVDTNSNVVKMRNGANDAWLTMPFAMNASNTAPGGLTVSGSNLTLDGVDIAKSGSADLTLDSGGRIDLSADDNGEVRLFDGASNYGQFKDDDDRLTIQGLIENKDMLFVVNDGSVATTAMKIIAADAGDVRFYGRVGIGTSPENMLDITSSGNTDQNFIRIKDSDGNQQFRIFSSSSTGDPELRLYNTSGSSSISLNTNDVSYLLGGNLSIGATTANHKIEAHSGAIASKYDGSHHVAIRGLSGGQYIQYASGNALSFVAIDTYPNSGASTKATIRTTGALEVGAGFTSGQGGDDGNNVGIKMSEYDLTINSENVSSGYVDVETNINRANYIGCIPSIYDSTANVAKMGYRSDAGFVTYADGYTNTVRIGLGGDVAAGDIVKLVVMYV